MSTMKKFPQRPMPTKFNAPRVTVDTENTGKLMSLVQQGNFGEIYNVIGSMAVDVNMTVDDDVLINAIIEVSPEQVSEERKLELIDYLVTHNQLSINIHGKNDLTPVHIACKEGHELILDYLLKHGANVDATTDLGMTPMHYATLINLKSCPDPKTPGPLMKKRTNTGVKVSDITKQMMNLFLNESVNSIGDENNTETSMIVKFKNDMKILEVAQKIIIKSYVEKNITNDTMAYSMDSSKIEDLIETMYNDAVKNLKELEYPDNILKKADLDDINADCGNEQLTLLRIFKDEIVNSFFETLFETVEKEISEYLKQKENYINEIINQDKQIFTEVFEPQKNMFSKVNISGLIARLVCGNKVTIKYLPDLIVRRNDEPYKRKAYDPDIPGDPDETEKQKLKTDVVNFCRLFIPKLDWNDIVTIDDFTDKLIDTFWVYDLIGTTRNPVILDNEIKQMDKIALYSFIQVAMHNIRDKFGNTDIFIKTYVIPFIEYLNKESIVIIATIGNYFDIFAGYNNAINTGIQPRGILQQTNVPLILDEINSIEDFNHPDARERLLKAAINFESQPLDVKQLLTRIQKTLMIRLNIIKELFETQYYNKTHDQFDEIIKSEDKDLLEGIVQCRERFLYKAIYPNTYDTFIYTKIPSLTTDIKPSIIKRIAHIEGINITMYGPNIDSLDPKLEDIKAKYSRNVYKGVLDTTYDYVKQNVPAFEARDQTKYNEYEDLKKEFETIESTDVKADDIVNAVSTFISFILTMHMRYFYDFNGKFYNQVNSRLEMLPPAGPAPAGAAPIAQIGPIPRAANNPLDRVIIQHIKESFIYNNGGPTNYEQILTNDLPYFNILLDKIEDYFSYFDDLFVNNSNAAGVHVQTILGANALNAAIPAPIFIDNKYLSIDNNPAVINAIIIKSAYNMVKSKYKNIDKQYLQSILNQSIIQLEYTPQPPLPAPLVAPPDPRQKIYDLLNTTHINYFRNIRQYKTSVYNQFINEIKESKLLTMQLYTFPFVGYANKTLCTSFFRNIEAQNNPAKDTAYVKIQDNNLDVTMTASNILAKFDVPYNSDNNNPIISLAYCLDSLRKTFIFMIEDSINSDSVKQYKNIFSSYKTMALYIKLYLYMMTIQYNNPTREYLEEMKEIIKGVAFDNISNPTNNILDAGNYSPIVEKIIEKIFIFIDQKQSIIDSHITDIEAHINSYKTNISLNNTLYSLIVDLKTCYNFVNIFSFVDIQREKYIISQLLENKMAKNVAYIKTTMSEQILYVGDNVIGKLKIPDVFKNVEKIILTLPSSHYFLLTYKTFFEQFYENIVNNNSIDLPLYLFDDSEEDKYGITTQNIDTLNIIPILTTIIDNCKDADSSDKEFIKNANNMLAESLDVAKAKSIILYLQCGNYAFPQEIINHTLDNTPIYVYDIMDYEDIENLAKMFYAKTVNTYTPIQTNTDGADIYTLPQVNDETKKMFLKSHMMSIYEKFTVNYIRQYTLFFIREYIATKIDPSYNFKEKKAFNPSAGDLEVDLTKLNSALVGYITDNTKDIGTLGPIEFDVKLIEDEEYDIYARKDNVIEVKGEKKYIFYSFDYFSKQTGNICLSINTKIIEKLLENNASLSVQDTNDMTPIKYIIEGRMYYLINSITKIRKACLGSTHISTIVNYEQRHNALYYDDRELFYKNKTYAMLQKFEKELIRKLKSSESVANNVPINIRYVFWAFTALQNIYWYRRMTKHFAPGTEFESLYNEKYIQFVAGTTDVENEYKWQNFHKLNVESMRDSVDKATKYESKRIRSNEIPGTNVIEDGQLSDLSDSKLKGPKFELFDIKLDGGIQGDIELFKYYENIYSNFRKKPILYTTMWKDLYDKYISHTSTEEHAALIHHKLQKTYTEKLNSVIIERDNSTILDGYVFEIDENKKRDLITESVKLDKLFQPISEYIDDRMLPLILDNNRMLLTQVRILCHILSTFLGSHLITYCRTLLYKEISTYDTNGRKVTYDDIEKITEPLKLYVCSTEDVDGNLSYDFLKNHMRFKKAEEDEYSNEATNILFMRFGDKLKDLESRSLTKKSSFIESLNISMASYYHTLYKEITNTLLEYSDSYYRFIKNQHLGIKCIASLQEPVPP